MEIKKANVTFGKAGDDARRNSSSCSTSFPKTWIDCRGITPERREVQSAFDGNKITIQQSERDPIKQVPLANNKRIHAFASVWEQLYKNHANIPFVFF